VTSQKIIYLSNEKKNLKKNIYLPYHTLGVE